MKPSRGRPSQLDEKKLAEYLSRHFSSSYEDLRKLTTSNVIIKNAAQNILHKDDKKSCIAVVMCIRRNSRGFSKHLFKSKPLIKILQDIVIKESENSTRVVSTESATGVLENNQECGDKPSNVENKEQFLNTFTISSPLPSKNESLLFNDYDLEISPISRHNHQSTYESINNLSISTSNEKIPESLLNLSNGNTNNTIIRPLNSRNLKSTKWQVMSYKFCTNFEGCYQITHNELSSVMAENKLVEGWTYLLNKTIAKYINNVCTINYKCKRYVKSKDLYKIYGLCSHSSCKKFVILINNIKDDVDHRIDVYSSHFDYNHLGAHTRYLKGVERKIARRNLKNLKPYQYRSKVIKKSSSNLIKEGNLQNIKSDSVIRKVRSEQLGKNDRHKDDIIDLILMQRCHSDFIQQVGQPFHVHIFSLEQFEILEKSSLDKKPTLHLDSTGCVARKPNFVNKKIFYYAGVINTPYNNRIVPILEMFSCDHDAVSIGIWLAKFKHFCIKRKNKWPVFSAIVTDYSYALMNAALYFINRLDLSEYLELTYNYIISETEETKFNPTITPLFICCSHFFKIIAGDIKKLCHENPTKTYLKQILGSCFNFTSIEKFKLWFKNIVVLLSSPYKSEEVDIAFTNLLKLGVCEYQIEMDTEFEYIENPLPISNDNNLFSRSPFYRLFYGIFSSVHEEIDRFEISGKEKNCFFDKGFLEVILKKYLPFLPLWSGVLFCKNPDEFAVHGDFSISLMISF